MNSLTYQETHQQTNPENTDYTNMRYEQRISYARSKQKVLRGILGGILGAVLAAELWGAVAYFEGSQNGWMAVVVGLSVGFFVRFYGKGVDLLFGVIGGVLALAGCLLGALFSSCILISYHEMTPLVNVIGNLSKSDIAGLFEQSLTLIDVLFYIIAVFSGVYFSIVKIRKVQPVKTTDSIKKD